MRAAMPSDWLAMIDRADHAAARARLRSLPESGWRRALGEAGLVAPTWPLEYGGLGLGPAAAKVVERALDRLQVPAASNVQGISLAGPTLMQWGTEEQRRRYLKPILTHEEQWCQAFSEPGAGSDLAGLATRARRDGEDWLVHGQKVWISRAHLARFAMLIARSNPEVPKHHGITYFILDMTSPGVTVRPLTQLTGDAHFSEVFLDGVRIPDTMRIGPVDGGWAVALTTLANERLSLAGSRSSGLRRLTPDELVRRHSPVTEPELRQRLVRSMIDARVLEWLNGRIGAQRRSGQTSSAGSIARIFQADHNQRVQTLAMDLAGAGGLAWKEGLVEPDRLAHGFLRARVETIAGGTAEIQRNVVGERVLGLPGEPRVDKDLPWQDVPRSG